MEPAMWRRPVAWIWVSVAVQIVGLAFDALWHGVLMAGVEPSTTREMAVHLATVHLVLYLGVIGLLVSTAWALVDHGARAPGTGARLVAFGGGVIQTVAEAWHATSHLLLRPNPVPEAFAFAGLVIVVAALVVGRRTAARRTRDDVDHRRAA
jgi:hypothetical protein